MVDRSALPCWDLKRIVRATMVAMANEANRRNRSALPLQRTIRSALPSQMPTSRSRRHSKLQNVVMLSLQAIQAPDLDGDDEAIKDVTMYVTMPIACMKQSLWWEGFELFVPAKHPTLYKEYVMCTKCSNLGNNTDSGIVKVGPNQSTSNLWSHTRYHHPEE